MEIEEVKLWQWMLAGLVAGFLFSGIVAWSGPGFEGQHRDSVLTGEFENKAYPFAIYRKTVQDDSQARSERGKIGNYEAYYKDQPLLQNVIVHQPLRGDSEHRYCVVGEYYWIGTRPKDPAKPQGARETIGQWRPFEYAASTPYVPGYAQHIKLELKNHPDRYPNGWVPHTPLDSDMAELRKSLGNKDSFPTVVEYLKAVETMPNSKLSFKQAWWERPAFMWSLPPLTGLLFIGVAWPLTLSILQNIGVAKRAPVKAPPKPLQKAEPIKVSHTAGVVLQPVKPAPPPPPPPMSENKEYGGEFYPVVKVAHLEDKPPTTKPAAASKPVTPAKPKAGAVKTK
jgi:hypothetical protein